MHDARTMFIFWMLLATLGLAALVLFGGGALLPPEHVATSTIKLAAKPADVWATITDWRSFKSWRKGLTAVEELPSRDKSTDGWVEVMGSMRIPLRVEKSEPEKLLVTHIATDTLPFGGSWSWQLEPTATGGTKVTTSEHGHVSSLPFRFLSKYAFGHHKTLNDVHRALAAKFGEAVEPVNS